METVYSSPLLVSPSSQPSIPTKSGLKQIQHNHTKKEICKFKISKEERE